MAEAVSMTSLKTSFSRQLKRIPPLFDVARRATRFFGNRTPVYELLASVSSKFPEVGFIQIGSNDGISGDPLREFVVAGSKWHGVFVEPVPQIFQQLVRNYSYLRDRKIGFINVAVSEGKGTKQFWKVRDACLPEFPLFVNQIGSFDREHVLKHLPKLPDLESKLEALEVPCETYEQIRERAGLSKIHVLHLDVEGHEHQIIRSMDFAHSKPLIILFEISHMSGRVKQEVFPLLQTYGYRLQEVGVDCIATLDNI
jgi:FkbM family methyltransferase